MEYYQAGGLDTTEELELALLLRDQELIHSEVARGQFPWLCCINKNINRSKMAIL